VLPDVWPWPLLQPRLYVPDWAAADSALKLSADPQSVGFDTENPWTMRKRVWSIGRALIRVEGIQPGWLPSVIVGGAVLELSPDIHLSSPGFAQAVPALIGGENRPPLRGVVQAALGVGRLSIQDSPEPQRTVVVLIRDADFKRSAPATGLYRGRAVVELTREEVVATLPVQAGAAFQEGPYRLVVDEVRIAPESLGIRARISDARTAFDRRPTPTYAFYLRNPQRSEAVGSSVIALQHNTLLTRFSRDWVTVTAHQAPTVSRRPDNSSAFRQAMRPRRRTGWTSTKRGSRARRLSSSGRPPVGQCRERWRFRTFRCVSKSISAERAQLPRQNSFPSCEPMTRRPSAIAGDADNGPPASNCCTTFPLAASNT
jgi:hypothetical protein